MKRVFAIGLCFVVVAAYIGIGYAAGTSKYGAQENSCMIDLGTLSSVTNTTAQNTFSRCNMIGGHGFLGFANTGTGVKNVTIQSRVTSYMGSGSTVWTNATGTLAVTPTNTDSFGYDIDATFYGDEYRMHCESGCSAVNTVSGVIILTPY